MRCPICQSEDTEFLDEEIECTGEYDRAELAAVKCEHERLGEMIRQLESKVK